MIFVAPIRPQSVDRDSIDRARDFERERSLTLASVPPLVFAATIADR
jgi:hypothetical protein